MEFPVRKECAPAMADHSEPTCSLDPNWPGQPVSAGGAGIMPRGGSPRGISRWLPWALVAISALCPVARGTQALGRVQELETQLQTSLVHPGLADGVPGAQARPALDIGLPLNLHLGQGVSPQRTQNATGGGGVADAQGGMSGGKRGEQGAAGLGQTGLGLPDWGTVRAWARRRKQSREQENEGGGEQEQRHEGRWQQQQGGQKQQQGGHEPLHGNPGNEFDTEEAYQKWAAAVGCEAFRAKHRDLVDAYSPPKTPSDWPPNPSLQAVSPVNCSAIHRPGVLIFVSAPAWLRGSFLEEYRVCPRCGITCQFTMSRGAAWRADAHVFVRTLPKRNERWWEEGAPAAFRGKPQDPLDSQDPQESQASQGPGPGPGQGGRNRKPLVVFFNQEKRAVHRNLTWCYAPDAASAERLREEALEEQRGTVIGQLAGSECPDLVTGIYPEDDVQLTYASFSLPFKAGQNIKLSPTKDSFIPLHRSTSNCAVEARERLAEKVLGSVAHHSFGACLNSFHGLRGAELTLYPHCRHVVSTPQMQEVMRCVRSHYKFDLALENSADFPQYVTEKFYVNLEAGTVPVYYGAADISNFAPPESFIDVRKFNSTEDLVAYIKGVNDDPVEYMNFHAWRYCNVWGKFAHAHALGWTGWPCRLCEKVASMRKQGNL